MGLSSDGHCLPLADLLHLPPPRAERAGLMTRVRFVDRAVFPVSGVNRKWGIRKSRELPRSSVLMVQACWSLSDDSPEVTPYSVGSRRCSSASSLNRPCGPALLGGGGAVHCGFGHRPSWQEGGPSLPVPRELPLHVVSPRDMW